MPQSITIIIPAYNADKYIEECLDSIQNQTYFNYNKDYQIIIAVDGCKKTLNKIKSIAHKYYNLEVYMLRKNSGTYIALNSVLHHIKNDLFIVFGADDTMFSNMISTIMQIGAPLMVRHDGVIFCQTKHLNALGGFSPWRCAGDSDFRRRLERHLKTNLTRTNYYFNYRQHPEQITKQKSTDYNSELRLTYKCIIDNNLNPIFIKPIKSKTKKIMINKRPKVYAGVASFGQREKSLKQTVNSIINQVDKLYVYLNDYNNIPEFLANPKIKVYRSQDEVGDLGDVGKFYYQFVEKLSGIFLTIDDDIIYNSNYVNIMVDSVLNNKNSIISLHGRSFAEFPISSYYKHKCSYYPCSKQNLQPVKVQFGGTGVMAFHSDTIKFDIDDFSHINMADIFVGIKANTLIIPIIIPDHYSPISLSNLVDNDLTIYAFCHNNDKVQTDIVNQNYLPF